MPTIQVPVYNMRIYSVVGLTLKGYGPTVVAPQANHPTNGQLALQGLQPRVDSGVDPAPAVIATTDAEFTNTTDMRLILAGKQPQVLRGTPTGNAAPETLAGSAALEGQTPVRAYGLYTTGYAPSLVRGTVRSMGLGLAYLQGKQPSPFKAAEPVKKSPQERDLFLTGLTPSPLENNNIRIPGTDDLFITGRQPQTIYTLIPKKKSPQNGFATFSGLTPEIEQVGPPPRPSAGTLSATGQVPAVNGAEYVNVSLGTAAISGKQPQVLNVAIPVTKVPEDGSAVLAGIAPETIVDDSISTPDIGASSISGKQPQLLFQGSDTKKVPQNAEMGITGRAPFAYPVINIPTGTLTLTGLQPGHLAEPSADTLALAGAAPTADLSSQYAQIGNIIQNTHATTDNPTNYQIDDITGFKVPVDEPFIQDWRGYYMRKKSWSERHPQDFVRGVDENQTGSDSPEPDDEFIEDLYPDGVTSDDL